MNKKRKKLLKKYLALPYTVHLRPTRFKGKIWWMATFPEIDGIMSDGKTRKKALKWGMMALREFLEVAVTKPEVLKHVKRPNKKNAL